MRSSKLPIVALLTAAILTVGGLSACSAGATPEKTPTKTPTAATSDLSDPNEGGSAKWKDIVTAANKEGEVVFYVVYPSLEDRLTAGFAKDYPNIKLTIVRNTTAATTAKLDQEKANGAEGADVVNVLSPQWYRDNLEYLVKTEGPMYDKYWKGSDRDQNPGLTQLNIANMVGIAVNDDLVKSLGGTAIKKASDIFQPKLKGALGMVPPLDVNATALQSYNLVMTSLGGDSAVKKLADLKPTVYPSAPTVVDAIASGEIAAGIAISPSAIAAAKAAGAPIRIVPFDPTVGSATASGIVSWASHPNAAQVFQNWLLSPSGQKALTDPGDGALSPLPPGTFGTLIPDDRSVTKGAGLSTGEPSQAQKDWFTKVWAPAFPR